jgi:hypothetical protein
VRVPTPRNPLSPEASGPVPTLRDVAFSDALKASMQYVDTAFYLPLSKHTWGNA